MQTDAFHHTRAEISLDTLQRDERHDVSLRRLILQAMCAVGYPPSYAFDARAWRDGRGGPDDDYQIALAAPLHAEHTEARLLPVESYAFRAAREMFQRRPLW